MTNDLPGKTRDVSRVTVLAHQSECNQVVEAFGSLGIGTVLVEKARCVRQRLHNRLWGLLGLERELSDTPMEIHRVIVPRPAALPVIDRMAAALDLHTPGRGAIFAQDVRETGGGEPSVQVPAAPSSDRMLHDLSLITVIQSMLGSGENLARIALNLGAGVPVVSLGIGTGIRDRLGLIRVTISPEKELVNLMVPAHDADGMQALLIEEGHLDRPGGGFLYQTPIRAGLVDPLIRIGRQEHAASLEQIIAAVDDLKKGTAWRKRFFSPDSTSQKQERAPCSHCEICFLCADGEGDRFVQAAMNARAQGATISRVRAVVASGEAKGRAVARERGVICVPAALTGPVLQALAAAATEDPAVEVSIQTLDASALFSHKRT